ncbi:MAG: cytochrome c [Gammaproteobacteria bacterium]|nr:cytochrome c [Gammaproteobacteria bacterium]
MKKLAFTLGLLGLIGLIANFWLFAAPPISPSAEIPDFAQAIERGEYLFAAGGCISCHRGEEDTSVPSGGLALETEFGTFYAPNITPDRNTGIGAWSAVDFLAAMKHGRSPTGSFYFPAFPYRSYAGLTDVDVLDIAAYLMSLEAVSYQAPTAETPAWLRRWLIAGWNKIADFFQPDPESFEDKQLQRGAYLARNLGHCGECHTPRNALGMPDWSREYAGAELGEEVIEGIDATALADWTANNFDLFLILGMKPDGDFVGGDMNEVIEHNTSKLIDADRKAMAAFFTRHLGGE